MGKNQEKYQQYPESLPQTLNEAITFQKRGEAVEPEEGLMLSDADYQMIREKILVAIEQDCSENFYHKRPHTEEVEARFLRLAKEANLSPAASQLGGITALLHDYGHVGRTIRQETTRSVARKDISNEEFSAIAADDLLGSRNLTHKQIVAVQVGILGTSFGQTEGPYARPYKPLSSMDKLLAFADIAGFTKGFEGWMDESMDVYREMPIKNLPQDFDALIRGRNGFIGYLQTKLAEIEPLIGEEHAANYRAQLDEIRTELNSDIAKKYQPQFEAMRGQLAQGES